MRKRPAPQIVSLAVATQTIEPARRAQPGLRRQWVSGRRRTAEVLDSTLEVLGAGQRQADDELEQETVVLEDRVLVEDLLDDLVGTAGERVAVQRVPGLVLLA